MRIEEKLIQGDAAVRLLDAVAEQGEVQREAGQKEAGQNEAVSDRKDGNEEKDQTSLSNQGRLQGLTQAQIQKLLSVFGFESIDQAWLELMEWKPGAGLSLADNLEQLADLYRILHNGIVQNVAGSHQPEEFTRLNQLLSKALQKLSGSHVPSLTVFFQKYAPKEALPKLQNTIYQKVTGQTLAPGNAARFFEGTAQSEKGTTGARTVVEGEQKQGLIYKLSAKQGVVQFGEEAPVFTKMNAEVKQATSYSTSVPDRGKGLYTIADIESGERFAKHLTASGNLLENTEIVPVNNEVIGVVAAMTALKAEVFAQSQGVGKPMAVSVKTAVTYMIDCYITKAVREGLSKADPYAQRMNGAGGDVQPPSAALSKKEVYKVFHYILSQYQNGSKPNQAIKKGLEYAYSVFLSKKEGTRSESRSPYATYQSQKEGTNAAERGGYGIYQPQKEAANASRRGGYGIYQPQNEGTNVTGRSGYGAGQTLKEGAGVSKQGGYGTGQTPKEGMNAAEQGAYGARQTQKEGRGTAERSTYAEFVTKNRGAGSSEHGIYEKGAESRRESVYSKETGFFSYLEKSDTAAGLKKGCRILEKNWMEFLEAVRQKKNSGLLMENLGQAFWGAAVPPPFVPGQKISTKYIYVIFGVVVTAVAIAAVWF